MAVENEVEQTTQTESPQVEAPAIEEQTDQPTVDQQTEDQVLDVDSKEPKDPREYQIKRLAEENKRLKSERQGSAFDTFRTKVSPGAVQVDINNYKDEYGEVNWNAYNADLKYQAKQEAKVEARQEVQEILDEEKARTRHPDLFADEDTEKQMAAMWLWEKTQGNEVTVSEIADRFASRSSKDVSKAEKRGAEKILQEVNTKEQAGLSASGQTSQGSRQAQSDEDLEQLSAETRVGNQDAIVARLQKIPWANK